MSKRLIHWAKPESFEEDSIKKAAEEIGITPIQAAHILDDTFRFYRDTFQDPSMPDISVGEFLSAKPVLTRLVTGIKDLIFKYRAKLISRDYLLYKIHNIWRVRRRLVAYKYSGQDERNAEALRWKNSERFIITNEIQRLKQECIDAGNNRLALTEERYVNYITYKKNSAWKDWKRRKKFLETYGRKAKKRKG